MTRPDSTEQRAEELVSWTGCERLRFLWYRLRLTIAEMNYASCRMAELQMGLPPKRIAAPPAIREKALPVCLPRDCRWPIEAPDPSVNCLFVPRDRTEIKRADLISVEPAPGCGPA